MEENRAQSEPNESKGSMKRNILQLFVIGATGGLLTSGCVYSHQAAMKNPPLVPTGAVVVTEAPPAPRHEVVGTAPDTASVWVPGYWSRSNDQWVWIPGHFESRPQPGVVWVPGHWDKSPDGRGWVWTAGRWE